MAIDTWYFAVAIKTSVQFIEVTCKNVFPHVLIFLKVPQSTYRAPVEEDVIAKIREENRKRAEVSV